MAEAGILARLADRRARAMEQADYDLAALLAEADDAVRQARTRASQSLLIDVPTIPFGPTGLPTDLADADYYEGAARNIEHATGSGRLFGSNLTVAVVDLLRRTAIALRHRHDDLTASIEAMAEVVPTVDLDPHQIGHGRPRRRVSAGRALAIEAVAVHRDPARLLADAARDVLAALATADVPTDWTSIDGATRYSSERRSIDVSYSALVERKVHRG